MILTPDVNLLTGKETIAVLSKVISFVKNKDEEKTLNLDVSNPLGKKILKILKLKDKNTLFDKFIESFIIYSPENTALRAFQREGGLGHRSAHQHRTKSAFPPLYLE